VGVPDILVLQVGHSTCAPSSDPEKAKHQLHLEAAVIDQHIQDIDKLFDAVKAAVTRGGTSSPKTTVIVSTASRVMIGNWAADKCIWRLNRITARAAHRRGFVVFEREEMEHRMYFKSEFQDDLRGLNVLDTQEPPVSHILSTSLLTMINCLQRNGTATGTSSVQV
jgi:hypothetical protein